MKGRAPRSDLLGVALTVLVLGVVSSGASLLALRVLEGTWIPPEGPPPLGPSLLGTATGAGAAAAVAWLLVGGEGLGLLRCSGQWMGKALALLPVFLAISALWSVLLDALGVPVVDQQFVSLLRGGERIWELLGAVYGILGAPVLEELLFRGLLLRALARRWGPGPGVVGSALLFGLLHSMDPQAVPPLVVLGLMLGWLRVRSGSLWPGVLLHAANNAAALALLLVADP